ncbi:MAG: CvpA family protein [Daejeonella sp.]|uniref:CvpA family protein n=1 Tax=Daejeonella sp. TaxID=2805397 RepID=UPI003C75A2B6
MNLVDLILLLIILLATYSGYRKGFILGAIDLLVLAAGLVFSFWASGYVVAIYERYVGPASLWTLPLAFIACFAVARMVIWSIAMKGLTKLPHRVHISFTNRLLGIVPGMINGLIYVAVLGSLLLAIPLSDGIAARARESSVATAASPYVQWIGDKLAPVFEDAVNRSITTLTVEPEASKSIALDFTLKNYKIREDLEAEMLVLINQERKKKKLPALLADPEMRKVARLHSADMFAKGYFSHTNKEGESPAKRARDENVSFMTAGENLALAPTLKLAHTGLMNSPGHRANILHKAFGRVGIGILDGGKYGLMVTQNFRN